MFPECGVWLVSKSNVDPDSAVCTAAVYGRCEKAV